MSTRGTDFLYKRISANVPEILRGAITSVEIERECSRGYLGRNRAPRCRLI